MMITWPPLYKIKTSKKARTVRLKISSSQGLVFTVPAKFDLTQIPYILQEKKNWITKHLSYLPAPTPFTTVPNEIYFTAIDKHWKIETIASSGRLKILERPNAELVMLGDLQLVQIKKLLLAWIKTQAQHYLLTLLQQLSLEHNLPYHKAIIRNQKTRWGSCSATGIISLNFKLLFLSPLLTKHVLLHELCHTKHLNHSIRFWKLLAQFDPDWETHRKALRANHAIPTWLESD